jgi:hypothetical protein
MSCQIYNTFDKIELPFPPTIKASDIVKRRNPCKVKSKGPNAFLIYRKAFLEHLSHLNYNLKMTDVSKLVSKYWENETKVVKDEYRKISKEVEEGLIERRKETVPNRLIWKNSTRKRNRSEKTTKTQKNKSEVNNHSNRNFQFIHTIPDTITSSSSSSQNHDTEITFISKPKNSCNPPENLQNLELSYCQEPIYNSEPDLNQFYSPCGDLQFVEDPITTNIGGEFTFDIELDLCLQSILDNQFYQPYPYLEENLQQQLQEEISLSVNSH